MADYREQIAAEMSGGVVAKQGSKDLTKTVTNSVGRKISATIDVVGKNGEYITVGGASKANSLGSWGDHLSRLKQVAEAYGTKAQAYLSSESPKELIDFTKSKLGEDNLKIE